MDQYFERIEAYASNMELPSRIRFMLQDIEELRRNKVRPDHSCFFFFLSTFLLQAGVLKLSP